jgi:uncharacterized membrane protein
MSELQNEQGQEAGPAGGKPKQGRARLVGIDAARGLALIGLMAVHILPDENEDTGDPSLSFNLFYGDSAALFALLAGVGLALASGGSRPHAGRRMAGDRLGLVARALLIGAVALVIGQFMPQTDDPPANGILLYYSVFFLLAIPFLHLRARTLFLSAAAFGIVAPILLQNLGPLLPPGSSFNPTLGLIFSEPAGLASQLLLTGSYPALAYMVYILVGLGIGRLDLRRSLVLVWIAGVGAGLAILSNVGSSLLLYSVGGGYDQMLDAGIDEDFLDESIMYGLGYIPDTSAWWLVVPTPHNNTPFSIASSLGIGLLVTAVLIAVGRKAGRWLTPLAAMGSMTLTLYSAHLLALSGEVHYDDPGLWFFVHVAVAVAFGMIWSRRMGQGPLERIVAGAARNFRQIADEEPAGGAAGASGPVPR